jgi:hypothetical protein
MTAEVAAAYARYLDAASAGPQSLRVGRSGLTPIDEADGELFLAGLMEGAVQFVTTDPARPAFVPWVTPSRRWMDNGFDSVYWMAPIDGQHRYRIAGSRGDECYLSFTVYAGDPGHPQTVVSNHNHSDLGVATGEPFELELAPPADACYVISRQYFNRPAQDRAGKFHIEVKAGRVPDAPGPAELAARWDAARSFLEAMTAPRPAGTGRLPAYVSTTPNVMGDPSVWSETEGGGRGTPDQTYASGPYALGPDEALVMDVIFPSAAYASVALWNRFSQTVDRRFHRSTINHVEAARDRRGVSRIVVAHRDPGVPNWLDTGGRPAGSLFWRFLLADSRPGPIACRVVPVDEVPADDGPTDDGPADDGPDAV